MNETDARTYIEQLNKKQEEDANESLRNLWDIIAKDMPSEEIHFVKELIQNADDEEGTTSLTISISSEAIIATNDGKKFDEADVEGICAVKSSKRNRPDEIGWYGIGFKSVFVVTDKPQVHSGPFHFQIHRYGIPEWTEQIPECFDPDRGSVFVLPLKNYPGEQLRNWREQIQNLSPETILFLRRVKNIVIRDEVDNREYSIEKEVDRNLVKLSWSGNGKNLVETIWRIFESDEIFVPEELRQTEKAEMRLDKTLVKIAVRHNQKSEITTHEDGNLFAFLPVQPSGLSFLVQADFDTTGSREGIKDNRLNQYLLRKTAEVLIKAVEMCKSEQTQRVDIYQILPTKRDSSIHHLIQETFVEEIQKLASNYEIVLTRSGQWVKPDSALIRRPEEIELLEFLDTIDLRSIYEKPCDFIHPDIESHGRQFLREVGVSDFDLKKLIEALADQSWFADKPTNWFIHLYAYFNTQLEKLTKSRLVQLLQLTLDVEKIAIIKTEQGNLVPAINPDDSAPPVYYPPDNELEEIYQLFGDENFTLVAHEIVASSPDATPEQQEQREAALSFLRWFGVKPLDVVTAIDEIILPKFQSDEWTHLNHDKLDYYVNFVQKHWLKYKLAKQEADEKVAQINLRIRNDLPEKNREMKELYSPAHELFIPNCYHPKDDLEMELRSFGFVRFVSAHYINDKQNQQVDEWKKFFVELGVKGELDVISIIDDMILQCYVSDKWTNLKESNWFAMTDFIRRHLSKYEQITDHIHRIRKHLSEHEQRKDKLLGDSFGKLKTQFLIASTRVTEGKRCWYHPDKLYLPLTYSGNSNIELILHYSDTAVPFVHSFYLEHAIASNPNKSEEEIIEEWSEFFVKIGVIRIWDKLPVESDEDAERWEIIRKIPDYCKTIDVKSTGYKKITQRYRCRILETVLPKMQNMTNEDRLKIAFAIADILDKNWKYYSQYIRSVYEWRYRSNSNSNSEGIDSEFAWYLKNTDWIPCGDGIFKKPIENLYIRTDELYEIFGDSLCYVHDDLKLTDEEFIKFLGIRREASSHAACRQLRYLKDKGVDDISKCIAIYQYLYNHVGYPRVLSSEDIIYVPHAKQKWLAASKVFWNDESDLFGNHRGYLSKEKYPAELHPFFKNVGVSDSASINDCARFLTEEVAFWERVDNEDSIRLFRIYQKIGGAFVEGAAENEDVVSNIIWWEAWWESTRKKSIIVAEPGDVLCTPEEAYIPNERDMQNAFKDRLKFVWVPENRHIDEITSFLKKLEIRRISEVANAEPQIEGCQPADEELTQKIRNLDRYIERLIWHKHHPEYQTCQEDKIFSKLTQIEVRHANSIAVIYSFDGRQSYDARPPDRPRRAFYHVSENILYFVSTWEKARDEVAAELSKLTAPYCEAVDFMANMLIREPEQIEDYLQTRGIGALPEGESTIEMPDTVTLTEHPAGSESTNGEQIEENELQVEAEVQTETPVESDIDVVQGTVTPVATDEVSKTQKSPPIERIPEQRHPRKMPETQDVPKARGISEIREHPGSSSSETTTSAEGRFSTGSSSSDYEDTATYSAGRRSTEIGSAGEEQVKIFEEQQGRKAKIVSHLKIGYDIESEETDGTIRYIEVKTASEIPAPGLTRNEFKKSMELGDQYFLYVVENFADDTCVKFHVIQNPANKIATIQFSQWRNIVDESFDVKLVYN